MIFKRKPCSGSLLKGMALILLILPIAQCHAEDSSLPEAVTIQQLLDITRHKSKRFSVLKQQLEAANAELIAAGVLPNPRISYGRFDLLSRQNTMYDGNVQQQVTLDVPVLIAGQRGVRINAAEKHVDAKAADIDAEFNNLLHEEWLLFVKQLADRQRLQVLEETSQYMEHLVAIVSGRAEAGYASPYDQLRLEIEAKNTRTRLEGIRNDLSTTVADLGVLLGFPGWKPQALGTLAVVGVANDLGRLWEEAEHSQPDIETSRRETIAADAELEKAERERWPVPSFQVGTVFTDQPYGNTSFAGVSVDIPIFDRGQGAIARAAATKQASLLQYQYLSMRTRAALERALDQLDRRRKTRADFEHSVVEKLTDLKNMGEASYRLGKGSLLELLDASRARTDTRLTQIELLQSEIEAELEVLRASGLLLRSVENENPSVAIQ